jgi:alpha-mannosidase
MPEGLPEGQLARIETFQSRSPASPPVPLDLQPLWRCNGADGEPIAALHHPWGPRHRPDWTARGLVSWPRGGLWRHLRLRLERPAAWAHLGPDAARARLCLRWWADAVELRVAGEPVHAGDLFDTACRWELPLRWWQGEPLELELRLRSPLHDDGALILSQVVLEPRDPADPFGLLAPTVAELERLRHEAGMPPGPGVGRVQVLGHAHLDLAWLWPVADTWRAAERTFRSALDLLERFPQLHFGHSTPALYAWLEQHRPALFAAIQAAMASGRWEPLNGPWVETDCVLVGTASLLRQFQEGQQYSRRAFPSWEHCVAWLPDSFGFSAGLPAVAAATGVRWFCTHKLAWNATNPFPHRLFRWRSRCGAELLALMSAPIGTDGDPVAIERYRLQWQVASGCPDALWLPGVGDHGGGPTAEMLEQLALWQGQPAAAPQRHGSLRSFLADLEPLAGQLPVWRDELYLELHRGCPTSRPDQKRHNRTLERLLREAELVRALQDPPTHRQAAPEGLAPPPPADSAKRSTESPSPSSPSAASPSPAPANPIRPVDPDPIDWRPLLFQQFHDILPGTSIPEVFEQAEPQWRAARRRARRQRDRALGARPAMVGASEAQRWRVAQLQPRPAMPSTLRLPPGTWRVEGPAGSRPLVGQPAPGGGQWVQLEGIAGIGCVELRRQCGGAELRRQCSGGSRDSGPAQPPSSHSRSGDPLPLQHPVVLEPAPDLGPGRWRLGNGLVTAVVGPGGVEQLLDRHGAAQLAAPLAWRRCSDCGEFWDAWDLAPADRRRPLPWLWQEAPEWIEAGPLCGRFRLRGRCGASPVRLEGRLLAGQPWLELVLSLDWRQRHELLRLEIPLASPAVRWAADTPAGVLERPAVLRTERERARWEVAALAWLASVGPAGGGGLAVLLDGAQGVDATAERLGVSLLRAPTWPDPGADNGFQRLRLALMPCGEGWRQAQVPLQARRLREPLWCHPVDPAVADLPLPAWPPLAPDLALVSLRASADGSGDLVVALQNEGPCRRRFDPGPGWVLLARLDGLDADVVPDIVPDIAPEIVQAADAGGATPAQLSAEGSALVRPWELCFWRLGRR